LTVMLVNKSTSALTTPIDFATEVGNVAAEVYTYDASNLNSIVQGADLMFTSGEAEIDLPGYSITLIEIPGSAMVTGDFDMDGSVGVPDIDLLCSVIVSGSHDAMFDLTGDGLVDDSDTDEMILNVIGTYYGDANLDGAVDVSDFNIWNSHKFSVNPSWGAGNFNCDPVIDASDFNIWNSNKFQVAFDLASSSFGQTPTPDHNSNELASGDDFLIHRDNNSEFELGPLVVQSRISSGFGYSTLARSTRVTELAELKYSGEELDDLLTVDELWIRPSEQIYSYFIPS